MEGRRAAGDIREIGSWKFSHHKSLHRATARIPCVHFTSDIIIIIIINGFEDARSRAVIVNSALHSYVKGVSDSKIARISGVQHEDMVPTERSHMARIKKCEFASSEMFPGKVIFLRVSGHHRAWIYLQLTSFCGDISRRMFM